METKEDIEKNYKSLLQKIKNDPYHVYYYKDMIDCLILLDRSKEAYDIVIQQLPNFEGYDKGILYNALGNMYLGEKKYELALEQYILAYEIYESPYFVCNQGNVNFELGKYEEAIKSFKLSLELDEEFVCALDGLGKAYGALGKNEEALQYFNQAIDIYNTDPLFYCHRGAIFEKKGDQASALKDLKKAKELIGNGKTGHNSAVFIKQIIEKIKSIVQLEEEQEKAQEIVDQASKTPNNDVEISKYIKKFQNLKEIKNKVTSQMIQNIQKETKTDQIEKKDEKEHILSLLNKDPSNFTEILQKFPQAIGYPEISVFISKQFQLITQQFQDIKVHQKKQDQILEKHETALKDGGVYEKAEIKKEFQALQDEDPQLYLYCNTFYWTCINLCGAYRNLSTGLVERRIEDNAKEDLLVEGAKKVAGYAVELASGVPFIGGVIKVLDKVIDDVISYSVKEYKENQFDNKVNSITKVIQNKFGLEEDISINVAKISIAFTKQRKQIILYPETVSTEASIEQGIKWLGSKLEGAKSFFLPQVEVNNSDNHSVALALQDLALFMAYLHKNHEAIISRKDPLDKQIISILKFDGFNMLIKGQTKEPTANEASLSQPAQNNEFCSKCSIF